MLAMQLSNACLCHSGRTSPGFAFGSAAQASHPLAPNIAALDMLKPKLHISSLNQIRTRRSASVDDASLLKY
jgi:hypothetical protein